MISPKEVKKTAELARIKLDTREEKELAGELESILGYAEKLKEVNPVSGREGSQRSSATNGVNVFRLDVPPKEVFSAQGGSASGGDPAPLLESAPETERGFIKVKRILPS